MADSILNHTLKNTLADVAGNIEIYLAGMATSDILQDGIQVLASSPQLCFQVDSGRVSALASRHSGPELHN